MEEKTAIIELDSIKDSDGWAGLCFDLLYEKFTAKNPNLDPEDELPDAFYEQVISKRFKYGEFANLKLEVDEDFNIVGGKIL